MSKLIQLIDVRTSYLYCHEAFTSRPTPQIPNPKPVYKSDFLMSREHPSLKIVAAAIEEVGSTWTWKGGRSWADVKSKCQTKDTLCLHNGDKTQAGDENYAGLYFLKGNNKKRFTILDSDKTPLTADSGRPYSGCYVNAIVDIYAQDNEFGQRINCTITGIQFVRHGEAFGGGAQAASPDEFQVVAGSADAAAPAAADDVLAGL